MWQQFVLLRHQRAAPTFASPRRVAPWIDQAQLYYLDAVNVDWRSAGLLYYYSFLNLAKALLVAKHRIAFRTLNTIAVHHGLRAPLQNVTSLADYQLKIFPPTMGSRRNVFANFYRIVTGRSWQFAAEIQVRLGDLLGYCSDISAECQELFQTQGSIAPVQFLWREENSQLWFELLVAESRTQLILSQLPGHGLQVVAEADFDGHDRSDWETAFSLTPQQLKHCALLRTPPVQFTAATRKQVIQDLLQQVGKAFHRFVLPNPNNSRDPSIWQFIPNIQLAGQSIPWAPLLSDYLISFALATILRYQPQLLNPATANYFWAEAWCSQSPRTALAYFLMLSTEPAIILHNV